MANAGLSVWKSYLQSNNGDVSADDLIFAATLDKELPIQDAFYLEKENYDKFNPNRALLIVVWVLSIVVLVTGFVWLTLIAGRKETDEELHLNGFDKVPTELAAAGVIAIWIAGSLLLIEFWWRAGDHVADAVSYYFATDMSADVYSLGRVFWSFVTGLWTGALVLDRLFESGAQNQRENALDGKSCDSPLLLCKKSLERSDGDSQNLCNRCESHVFALGDSAELQWLDWKILSGTAGSADCTVCVAVENGDGKRTVEKRNSGDRRRKCGL